ncbi:hypothetical protein EJP82_11215 [Paenibacillus anaericanus]|uniref:Uncharacterized protein n=1 Tax=Paenibacillus anaericanus TaxID=170367 RepID=A0A3S1BPW6_9BACL|nr:hypothetical protein [Paenibacillus anaericanus]RUT46790.1 hypothetical protein EJP82_11215 [Paenibacillus anaericanus]
MESKVMFKIILESVNGEQLDQVFEEGNVKYLQQNEDKFEMLGELSTCSYDVYSSKDMDMLILELVRLKEMPLDSNEIKHIEEIISLADKCKNIENIRLIITPF